MRPQKLTLKNFMPFRSIDGQFYEVDFANLDLFAITGPTGSGKSALVDAIVWCLYGRTARYGADSKGVISTGENSCEVFLDFTIGSRWFRAVRRTGRTTESGLSEREGEEWIQDVSGAEQLTKRIEALLGLDFASFTKTVILPQGEYAQFLASKPSDRRELLAKILELGVYARVAERAKELSGRAKARADTIRDTLRQYANVGREQIAAKRKEWQAVTEQLQVTSAQVAVLREVKELAEKVTATRARIAELGEEEQRYTHAQEELQQRSAEAQARGAVLAETLDHLRAARSTLRYDPRQHEVLQRAVNHLHAYLTARHEADLQSQSLTALQTELTKLSRQIAEQERQMAAARDFYQERTAAVQAYIARHGDIAVLTERIAQAQRWQELCDEQARLETEQASHTHQLAEQRQTVTLLQKQEAEADQAMRALYQQRDQIRAAEQAQSRLALEAEHLEAALQEATRQAERLRRDMADALARLHVAEQTVRQRQDAVSLAEQQEQAAAQALEEQRRLHEVAHLRQTLQLGAPCPVCQTLVRELPSPPPEGTADLSPLHRAVAEARASLSRARDELRQAHERVAAARERNQAVAQELAEREQKQRQALDRFVTRFPGFSSPSAALQAVRAEAQALAATLQQLETQAQSLERERRALTRQREQAQHEEAKIAEALRGVTARLAEGERQLAVLRQSLASYLTAGNDPVELLKAHRHLLVSMHEEVKALEQQQRHAEDQLRALATQKMQKAGDCRVLASRCEAQAAQAEREAQAVREALGLPTDAPLPLLTELEQALAEAVQRHQQHASLVEREETLRRESEEVQREITALRADLRAHAQLLKGTREKTAASEQELARLRAQLQAAVQQHHFPGIGPDGEGVAEQVQAQEEHLAMLRERRAQLEGALADLERRCREKEQEEEKLRTAETEQQLAMDLTKLLGADFTDFLSRGAVELLMTDASAHLRRLTHGRYTFDVAYKSRAIELLIVDHEDQGRKRPTHSLSGGETFLASLAIALALAQGFREVAPGKAAKTSTECLILDEGFGTLDREGLQLVTETLQQLRGEEGRLVGIITHVEEIAAAMPLRIAVQKGNRTSHLTVLS